MVFSSLEFLFRFIPIFFIIYYMVPVQYRNYILLAGSLIFYAVGEPFYILLMLASVLVNYFFCVKMQRERPDNPVRKKYLILALVFDFSMLFIFKYTTFFIENINSILRGVQAGAEIPKVQILLPLGISFYTFQIAAYVIDTYLNRLERRQSLLYFATYVTMFPQLIAGPIVIYSEVYQELKLRTYSMENFEEGIKVFILGLGSKVLLANRIGILWNEVGVMGYASLSTPMAWMGALAYSFQIYFDFWGYSLMAIGLGKMLGFRIPKNFDHPYISKSVTEFWRRWHVTLGRWFREYLYIPLGGNRKGKGRTILNLLMVWTLTGFWHGASWNFVLWGVIFFVLISVEKLCLKAYLDKYSIIARVYMVCIMPITWVVFAITDMGDLLVYLKRLFGITAVDGLVLTSTPVLMERVKDYGILFLLAAFCSTSIPERLYHKYQRHPVCIGILFGVFWISVYQLSTSLNNPFLYFRF